MRQQLQSAVNEPGHQVEVGRRVGDHLADVEVDDVVSAKVVSTRKGIQKIIIQEKHSSPVSGETTSCWKNIPTLVLDEAATRTDFLNTYLETIKKYIS